MTKPEIKVERDGDRVFISAHDKIVDVHVTEDGITVLITKGNDVVAETYVDVE